MDAGRPRSASSRSVPSLTGDIVPAVRQEPGKAGTELSFNIRWVGIYARARRPRLKRILAAIGDGMKKHSDIKPVTPDSDGDVEFVRALAEILSESGLVRLEVERHRKGMEKLKVHISRSERPATVAPEPIPTTAPVASVPHVAPHEPTQPDTAGDDPAELPGAIVSPMVGTVYLAPEPGAPPFVNPGDSVTEGQTLLIIEAMKTMNQIHATASGVVKRILVEDASPVEYGAPLMIVGQLE